MRRCAVWALLLAVPLAGAVAVPVGAQVASASGVSARYASAEDPANNPPYVSAGKDLAIIAPVAGASVEAWATDSDGTIVHWNWQQLEGPPLSLVGADGPELRVDGLGPAGLGYRFRVTARDDGGAEASDEILIETIELGVPGGTLSGTTLPWHPLRLDFVGPVVDEQGEPNPFTDFRLDVLFAHQATGRSYRVPGYYAADGDAAESGATGGATWRARFTPDAPGIWAWKASFRVGKGVASSLKTLAGMPGTIDGQSGMFTVAPSTGHGSGFVAEGRLDYVGEHFLRHAGSGKPFLKGGADSPENLLAFGDFDQTTASHAYAPHVGDWEPGDPTWLGDRGKGLVGALNYLADQGMNAVYFLTFNVGGDGDDVWMWTDRDERLRYDCSKLDQWEIVFAHMDRLGLMLHVVTQEFENGDGPLALDGGELGMERRIYYRELVARFGHHLGVSWNLGEEITNSPEQIEAFHDHIRALDAYEHPIVSHTFPSIAGIVYQPALDGQLLDGPSMQILDVADTYATARKWRALSDEHGKPWVVTLDEIGPPGTGVVPDSVDFWHDEVRRDGLWGSLMAGGAGAEWYFGSDHPNDDLDCEDWRSRENMWRQTDIALDFFHQWVPFDQMQPSETLIAGAPARMLALPGETYLVYLSAGGEALVDLQDSPSQFRVRWFDPRVGGPLIIPVVNLIQGPGWQSLGNSPGAGQDWVGLVTRWNQPPVILSAHAAPGPVFADSSTLDISVHADDPDGLHDIASVDALLVTPLGEVGPFALDGLGEGEFGFGFVFDDQPVLPPGHWILIVEATDQLGLGALLQVPFAIP